MKIEIVVPSMGESVSGAVIGQLLKQSGAIVAQDEEVLELETDKVNQVLYAPQAGQIMLNVSEEDSVVIGQVLGYIDTSKAVNSLSKAEEKKDKEEDLISKPGTNLENFEEENIEKSLSLDKIHETRVFDFEYLKKIDEENSSSLPETSQLLSISSCHAEDKNQPPTRKRMSKIRRVIAERLVQSQNTSAMLTTFNEVDMSSIILIRKTYQEKFVKAHNVKLGFMSFFVKAVIHALQLVPEFNCFIDGEDLVQRHSYDIGIAVGTERGLVVPVLRSCHRLKFSEIEAEIVSYAKSAREGGLQVDDMMGGGFTITNGGIYGSLLSTPILNPPQCGILGMHKIQKRAVVVDDKVVIRPMMYLALSYDHRIVDGKEAVTFLVAVKDVLEDPQRLLIDT
jgi:2-oxoglutarate dehydrogenase E2 component (dihydrolipoamide succinyltransferase)